MKMTNYLSLLNIILLYDIYIILFIHIYILVLYVGTLYRWKSLAIQDSAFIRMSEILTHEVMTDDTLPVCRIINYNLIHIFIDEDYDAHNNDGMI